MDIINSITFADIIINIAIIIVLIIIARHCIIYSIGKSVARISKRGSVEVEIQKTKYWLEC